MPKSHELAIVTPTEIEEATTIEARVQSVELRQQIENEAVLLPILQELHAGFPDAVSAVGDIRRSRHADNTIKKYDYWLGRFRTWCEEPETRYRMKAGFIPFALLWPMGAVAEGAVAAWLTDTFMGPDPKQDEDAYDRWLEQRGVWAPNTLGQAVAAIKARSRDFQSTTWEPTQDGVDFLKGLRNRLAQQHKLRQAEPICVPELRKMARHLYRVESPMVARYRLCFELAAVGLTPGQQAHIDIASIVADGRSKAGRSIITDGQAVTWDQDGVFGRRLIVAGQRRRGGNRDKPTVIELAEHPHLEEALDLWLDSRDTAGVTGVGLLFGDVAKPVDQIKQTLERVADIADIKWRARRGETLDAADIAITRSALDDDDAWGGQLIRRRTHVMALVGWWGAMRRSELVNLRIENITFASERQAVIDLLNTKTGDHTCSIFNPANTEHAADQVVTLLRQWVAMRQAQGAKHGTKANPGDFVFPTIDRHGNPGEGGMSGRDWSERLNATAREAAIFDTGNADRYERITGHSLRRGFVTAAVDAGHDAVKIAQKTRHKDVKMVALYADERQALNDDSMSGLWTAEDLDLVGRDWPQM